MSANFIKIFTSSVGEVPGYNLRTNFGLVSGSSAIDSEGLQNDPMTQAREDAKQKAIAVGGNAIVKAAFLVLNDGKNVVLSGDAVFLEQEGAGCEF